MESWHLPTPRDWRLIGGALLLLVAGAVVVVIQSNGPAPVPADSSDAIPRSIVPPIPAIDADSSTDTGRASHLPNGLAGGSIRIHGVPVPARIVFMNGRGYGDIYEMNEDGSGQRGRVTDPGHDCGPAYSPDGRYLMFSSQRSSGSASVSNAYAGPARLPWYPLNFDLYLLDLQTGARRQVTTNPGIDFTAAWSPDGRRIAFSRGSLGQLPSIWVMNADGTGLRQLTQQAGSTFHWIPDWSPAGNRIVYMSFDLADLAHPSVRIVDSDGANDRVLAGGGFPAWSPDGRSIVFASSRGQLPGEYDVYVMDADGSHQRRLQHQQGAEFFPHWSPDGRSIVYVQDSDGWVFEVTMLLPDGAHSLDVEISRPALSSFRARTLDEEFGGPALSSIWRMRADGSNPVQLTQPNGDLFPIYAPAPKS